MITEIRNYFKGVITSVDADLKEHNEYFTSENIADTNLENKYFIQFLDLSTLRQDSDMVGTVSLSITLWKNGYSDIIANLDKAYECAIEIQAKAMQQANITQDDFIKSVAGVNITPAAVEDNNNLGAFTLTFEVTTGYKAY